MKWLNVNVQGRWLQAAIQEGRESEWLADKHTSARSVGDSYHRRLVDVLPSLQLSRTDVVIKAYPPDWPNIYLKVVNVISTETESCQRHPYRDSWQSVGTDRQRRPNLTTGMPKDYNICDNNKHSITHLQHNNTSPRHKSLLQQYPRK